MALKSKTPKKPVAKSVKPATKAAAARPGKAAKSTARASSVGTGKSKGATAVVARKSAAAKPAKATSGKKAAQAKPAAGKKVAGKKPAAAKSAKQSPQRTPAASSRPAVKVAAGKARAASSAKASAKPAKAAPKKPVGKVQAAKVATEGAVKRIARAIADMVKPAASAVAVRSSGAAKPDKAPKAGSPTRVQAVKKAGATTSRTATKDSVPPMTSKPTTGTTSRAGAAKEGVRAKAVKREPSVVSEVVTAPVMVRVELPEGYRPKSDDEYMNPYHLEYFRQKLLKWREDLVEESKQTIDNLRDEVRDVGDEAERATRETENSLELRTRDRYRKLIGKIDKALKRIDDGSYGYCEETGEEIGVERLEARPIATLCLDAQERWEHRQKLMGD